MSVFVEAGGAFGTTVGGGGAFGAPVFTGALGVPVFAGGAAS